MKIRIVSGLMMAALVMAVVMYMPLWGLKIAVACVVALAARELAHMFFPGSRGARLWMAGLSVALALGVMFASQRFFFWALAIPLALMLIFSFHLFRPHASFESLLPQLSQSLLGVLYLGLLPAFWGLIAELRHGQAWLLLVLGATFGADTGAYLIGKRWGRHKLAPRVSPGKTLEGFVGGWVFSLAACVIWKFLAYRNVSLFDCAALGTLIGFVGPLGDLSESMIKRSLHVKDSGQLIPGHGGMLDRIDALLFTGPVAYYYVVLTGLGMKAPALESLLHL